MTKQKRRLRPTIMVAKVVESAMGRFVIVLAKNQDLAWSGSKWVPHVQGIPVGSVQVCNFATREEALEYIKTIHPTYQ